MAVDALPHIAAMTAYPLAELDSLQTGKTISLAQNESLRGPSPKAVAAATRALTDCALYPDPGWTHLRRTLADHHNIDFREIVCGAGSMELIGCVAHAFLDRHNAILVSEFCYPFFKTVAAYTNARIDVVPEKDLTVCVDTLLAGVRPDTKIVFVANPGNPTGTRIPKAELVRLRTRLPDGVLLVIDEAYQEFHGNADATAFDMTNEGNTLILRTFSKAYGLAGMRVGWGLFPPDIALEVTKLLNPNNVTTVAQAAAAAAVEDDAYMQETVHLTAREKLRFVKNVEEIGLRPIESTTNFVLVDFITEAAATSAENFMRTHGIFLRKMAGYGLPTFLRVTMGNGDDMEVFYHHLSEWKTGGTIERD